MKQNATATRLATSLLLFMLTASLRAANSVSNTVTHATYANVASALSALTEDGQTLLLSPGVYTEPELLIAYAVAIQGQDAASTVIQPSATPETSASRVATVNIPVEYGVTQPVVFKNLTLRHGRTSGHGGAVSVQEGSVLVSGCVISNNAAGAGGSGGGLFCMSGSDVSLSVTNTLLTCNTAGSQGGGLMRGSCQGCALTANQATDGGGAAYAALDGCDVVGNSASGQGGGLYLGVANRSRVTDNGAVFGGGAFGAALANSLLAGNDASQSGGGLYQGAATNCTLAANTAASAGGGLWGGSAVNSIIYGNQAASGADYGGSAALAYCCAAELAPGVGNLAANPRFRDVAHGDFALLPQSPCLNTGNSADAPAGPDLSCGERILGAAVDMGAFEFDGVANLAPVAQIDLPPAAYEGRPVILVATNSYDPNGDELQYAWDFNNDGLTDSTNAVTTNTWALPGAVTVWLTVADQSLSNSVSATFEVLAVNHAPSFTEGGDQTVNEDSGPRSYSAWAIGISKGPAHESWQTLTFVCTNTAPALFSSQPAISASNGTLSFTPAPDANGSATVSVYLRDSGGTAYGGQDCSPTQTFQIVVNAVNDAPVLTVPTNRVVNELTPVVVTNTSTDVDSPANTLRYELLASPSGMTLDTNTGAIAWTPSEAQGPSTNTVTVRVYDSGTPFMAATNSFTVTVNEVNLAPALTVPADQIVSELTLLSVTNTATDADLPANALTFELLAGPAGLTLDANTGAIAWTPAEAQGPSTNTVTVRVYDSGEPTLAMTNSFAVTVNEVNSAPALTVPADQIVSELTLLSVTNTATDADLPANALRYELLAGPSGMTLDTNTGAIAWTPAEAQGPSTNTVTVRVYDSGEPTLAMTNSFTVTVNEVNSAPALTVPADQIVSELTLLSVTNTATDADLPANALTFELMAGPAGLTLDANTGVIAWTPTEAQGPSTNTVTVRVYDSGEPTLAMTNSFTITVNEVNSAPALTVPADQIVSELALMSVTNTATDADLPANALTFELLAGPSGMSLDTNTGVIAWTPTEAQGPSANTVTVRVYDSGEPTLAMTNSFTVTVNEVNSAPALTVPADQVVSELALMSVTNTATDADLPANALRFELLASPAGMTLDTNTGVIAWTPAEAQGPSTNTITVRVCDSGEPTLAMTNSFTVTVNEVNSVPVLTVPTNCVMDELTLLSVTNTATDTDLPANALTFELLAGPAGLTLDTNTGVIAWTPAEAQGPSTNTVTVRVCDSGEPALAATNSFMVTVNEVNSAPALAVPADQIVSELALMSVTNTATDADVPANALTFELLAGPSGMSLDTNTGVIAWTPAEAQGPSANTVTVRVYDSGEPTLAMTNSFTVTVNEVNSAPALTVPADQIVSELALMSVTNTAADADLPANALRFELLAGPSGMTLDTNTGVIAWTPAEAQGPSANTVTVRVYDSGEPTLAMTNSFTVTVNEVNSVPVLTVPTNCVMDELTLLSVTNTAADADFPANTLQYELLAWPNGMTLDTNTGVIAWTPTEAQGPSTNTITVRVYDSGTPSMAATNSFIVWVHEVNSAPVLTVPTNRVIDEMTLLSVTNAATDADLPANTLRFELLASPSGMTLDTNTGVIAWTPTEAQGPSTNTVTVRVCDSGEPTLAMTNSFTVTVREVNTRPLLAPIKAMRLVAGETLSFRIATTDADLPANALALDLDTYSMYEEPVHAAVLDPSTGQFSWTTTEADDGNVFWFAVTVTDDGTPSLSSSRIFQVEVGGSRPSLSMSFVNGVPQLSWDAMLARRYQIQYKNKLTDAEWQNLGDALESTNGVLSIDDRDAPAHQSRFYRSILVPEP
jgi:hypothetical protein